MSELEPATHPAAKRVSDADRQAALDILRQQCAAGTLTLDEFSDRCGDVLAALDEDQLTSLTADLPALAQPGSAGRRDRSVRRVIALFGSNRRRARWRVGRRATAVAVGGAAWMDLRQAQLVDGELTVRALPIMGTVKIIVPAGIGVEVSGASLIGATTDRTHVESHLEHGPLIRVRAWPILGSVRITNSPPPGAV